MILVNNLVVIRFLPWSDRLGYFCIFVEEYSRETQIQIQQITTKSAFACFFHAILLLTTKNIVYLQREFEIKTLAKDQRIHFIYYVQNIHFPFLVVFIRL